MRCQILKKDLGLGNVYPTGKTRARFFVEGNMKKNKRKSRKYIESEESKKSFEKRRYSKVRTKKDYFRILNEKKKAAKQCIGCNYNQQGFCKKYNRFASNARSECKTRPVQI